MKKYFALAKYYALKDKTWKRYIFGAIGIRNDGCIVHSTNIRNPIQELNCHAETRLCRKLDKGSEIYLIRTNKNGSRMLLARPCKGCESVMKATGVKRVYYSISDNEFGQINFEE
jgi:tRNA(Arg) A34 adenosine deaminase TadA